MAAFVCECIAFTALVLIIRCRFLRQAILMLKCSITVANALSVTLTTAFVS